MQMVQGAAGQWGRMAPGCPDGRPTGWVLTNTGGPWSPWPRVTGTQCRTGWVDVHHGLCLCVIQINQIVF